MYPSNNYQGLLVFEKKGKVCLLWRRAGISIPGVFSVESSNGKVFTKASSLVAFFDADGAKSALGARPEFRASTLGTKSIIFYVHGRKGGVFATMTKGGSWKVTAEPTLFRGLTVCLKLPAKGEKKSKTIAFSQRGSRSIFLASSTNDLERFRDLGDVLSARRQKFDVSALTPLFTERTKEGIALVY